MQIMEKSKCTDENTIISIIMPAYQAERYIAKAVASVRAQTFQAWELLVVDDGSTDQTAQILERYREDVRIHYLRQPKNKGVAAARNRGIKAARGKYVAFLDADDWWAPDKLERQMACILRTKAVLCCTGRELMKPDGTSTGKCISVPSCVTYRQLLHTNIIPCGSVVMEAKAAREFGFVHDEFHEDYILWLKVLKKYGPAAGVNIPALKCRLSAGGKSRNKWKSARMQYGSYRCLGYGRLQAFYYMIFYTVNGFYKYLG